MKVVVTGSRRWRDWSTIQKRLAQLPDDTELIVGDARGADRIAAYVWEHKLGRGKPRVFNAYWHLYNHAAGPMRNRCMLQEEPDLVIAFRAEGISKGTDDCTRQAMEQGLNVEYFGERWCDANRTA